MRRRSRRHAPAAPNTIGAFTEMPAPPSANPTRATGAVRRRRCERAADGRQRGAACQQRPVAEPGRLAVEAPGGHRCAEHARAEPAHGGLGAQLPLEEERAPALDPALDHERRCPDEPDQEQRALDVEPPPLAEARSGAGGRLLRRSAAGPRFRRPRVRRRAGSARARHPGCARSRPRPPRRGSRPSTGRARAASARRAGLDLDPRRVRVDPDVERAGRGAGGGEREDQPGQRAREPGQRGCDGERGARDRDGARRRSGRSPALRRTTSRGSIRARRRGARRRVRPSTSRSPAARSAGPPPTRPRRARASTNASNVGRRASELCG